ncbi:hypothetical protein CBA19CS11_29415 [Caballeronia novacaledonica]|uniref:hypothetical protein n=1 Tax=Caballeronia novacaledonica TaxID=1544861 RepID=UPI001EE251B7|nr:hypothetical protein [Caballeronia novacaledonica]GJH13043.1 hypothetical protein CBA19CS11_29415 [Caballeronia novacaledonica]
MNHNLTWTAPQPFWNDASGAVQPGGALRRPQILRFTTDEFMNEMLATLAHDPASLSRFAVMEETWRGPGSTPAVEPERWLQRTPPLLRGVRRRALLRRRSLDLATAGPATPTAATTTALKLYQPAQMRHYLVGGSLVCCLPGLPDHHVDPARHKVSFVLRRLFPRAAGAGDEPLPDPLQGALWDEYAFVPKGKAGVWRRVAAADNESEAAVLLPAEERLPLFTAAYSQDDGHGRRLYVGSVPVGRREAYQGAAAEADGGAAVAANAGSNGAMDPRVVLFYTQVLGPWKGLLNRVMRNGLPGDSIDDPNALRRARLDAVFAKADGGFDTSAPDPDSLRTMRSALQTSSWYLLLDLYHFLKDNLGLDVLASSGPPSGAAAPLYAALNSTALPSGLASGGGGLQEAGGDYDAAHIETNLIAALRRIVPFEESLEHATGTFTIRKPATSAADAGVSSGWPDFLFLFADPWLGVLQPPTPAGFAPPAGDYLVEKIQARIDSLADLVKAALPPLAAGERVPEPTLASMQPADMREAWYVMRLVYERPDCLPFHGTVMSAATQPFRMAGFFDPDAPARPIRIGLPVDISPAGLRKFDKNAVFMMSDMLCGQVDRMKGMGLADLVLSVLPWPFHKDLNIPEKGDCKTGDGISLGVMCSLSIPIITICAMLLLIIIVTLLDFIFRWIPYFIVCFPLPGFKGRKE